MMKLQVVSLIALVLGCDGVSSHPGSQVPLGSIGLACDVMHPCADGATCGTCGIGTGQCVVACSRSGSGPAAGCPEGAYCSAAWSGTSTHVCVRTCQNDASCWLPTANTDLSCNGAYNDDGSHDPQICNVSNTIASMHVCP